MRSFAFRLGLCALALVCFSAQSFAGESLYPLWTGQMRQIDQRDQSSYPMYLLIQSDGASTNYPSLKCRGTLSKVVEGPDGYVVFKEKITEGALSSVQYRGCVDGLITVKEVGDDLFVGWFGVSEGEPIVAYAKLQKMRAAQN